MKIRNILASLLAIVTISTCSTASAGMYVFGGAGIMSHEYGNVSNPTAFKFGAGYMAPSNFGFEASYMNLGKAVIVSPNGSLEMSGTNFSGVFELPLNPLVMTFKLGIYNIDATAVTTSSASATSSGLSWGFLLGYQTSENVTLFMDTEGFNSVDAAGTFPETPALITFGVRVKL